jgi:hypothetical protein
LQFQRILQRFKVHSLALVALLFFVHIGMFALIYSLLGVQQTKVNHFSETGHGAAQVAQIATIATDIDIFLTNRWALPKVCNGMRSSRPHRWLLWFNPWCQLLAFLPCQCRQSCLVDAVDAVIPNISLHNSFACMCRTVRGLPGLDTRQDFVDMLDTLKGMIEAFRVGVVVRVVV